MVRRQWNGVGRGELVPSSLTSGIVIAWDEPSESLTGDMDAAAIQWLLTELFRRDCWIIRRFTCLLERDAGGVGIAVLPRFAIDCIVRNARARDVRAAAGEGDDAEVDAAVLRVRRRTDLLTLDNATFGPQDSLRPFENYSLFLPRRPSWRQRRQLLRALLLQHGMRSPALAARAQRASAQLPGCEAELSHRPRPSRRSNGDQARAPLRPADAPLHARHR